MRKKIEKNEECLGTKFWVRITEINIKIVEKFYNGNSRKLFVREREREEKTPFRVENVYDRSHYASSVRIQCLVFNTFF